REPDSLAVHVGAGVLEQAERVGQPAELEADLLEDRVGVVLDEREAFLAEDLERLERPCEERQPLDRGMGPRGRPAGVAAAPAPGRALGRGGYRRSSCTPGASDAPGATGASGVPWVPRTGRRRRPARSRAPGAPEPASGRTGRATTSARCGVGAPRGGRAIRGPK